MERGQGSTCAPGPAPGPWGAEGEEMGEVQARAREGAGAARLGLPGQRRAEQAAQAGG